MTPRFHPKSLEHEQRTLARFADGSLDGRDRAAVEAYVAISSEAQLRLAGQRRVALALRAGGPALSGEARAELDAMVGAGRRASVRLPPLPIRPEFGFAVAALVVAALVVGVAILGGGTRVVTPPSIAKTALLAYSSPTAPAPRTASRKLLRATFAGITFPNYASWFGVRATGERTDEFGGRALRTVFYRLPNGTPISYSIVSGTPLAVPAAAMSLTFSGMQLRGFAERGLGIVTLVRNGRTCVLAGRTPVGTLIALAEAPLRS